MTLAGLRAGTLEVLRRGGGSRPDVLRVRFGGKDAILKDQNGCDVAFARLIGPLLAAREARALAILEGMTGIPALLARPDNRSVLMEHIPAVPISRAAGTDWPRYFSALERLLDEMHAHGIAHCDLRSPDNTLVGRSGEPVLVDFVASVRRGSRWNPLGSWVFTALCRVDDKALIKLKSIAAPELIAPQERHLLHHESMAHRAVRGLGVGVRNLTRRLFTRSP